MKVLNYWLPLVLLTVSLAEPAYSLGSGGGGAGSGSAGVSGASAGGGSHAFGGPVGGGSSRAFDGPNTGGARNFNTGEASRDFHRTAQERDDFFRRHGVHGGGLAGGYGYSYGGYGYPDYGFNYGQPAVKDDYDERVHKQDQRRIEQPNSSIVKNYSWPRTK